MTRTGIKKMTKAFLVTWLLNWAGLLLIAGAFYSGQARPATMVFNGDFESGNLTGWTVDGNTPTVTGIAKRSGNFGLRSVLAPNMGTNYRSELKISGNAGKFGPDVGWSGANEYWIGFNVMFVDDPGTGAKISPMQFHHRPANWATWGTCTTGSQVDGGSFNIFIANGKFQLIRYNPGTIHVTMYQENLRLNVWYSIVVRYVPSYTSNGIIEAWVDGVRRASYFGINQKQFDNCGVALYSPYFQGAGTYRWESKGLPPTATEPRDELYLDNFKLAKTTVGANDGYDLVAPPGSTAPPPSDTTPPVISNVQAINVDNSTATITWTTNEDSDSTVNYGLTTGYGTNAADATRVTSHSLTLTGLAQGTTYNYRVQSKDAANNTGSSGNLTFATTSADTTKPVLSNPQVAVTSTTATFTWTTNENSTSRVKYYWSANPAGVSKFVDESVTQHTLKITDLTPSTPYTYKLSSQDAAGNVGDFPATATSLPSFTTAAQLAEPIISNVAVSRQATSATVTWTTNVAATSKVLYSPNRSLTSTSEATTLVTSHSRTLTGLTPNRVYYYRVQSANANGDLGNSATLTFVTKTASTMKSDAFQ